VRDITSRKQTEEELNKYKKHLEQLVGERTGQLKISENKYRMLFDTSNDSIFLMRRDIIIDCNLKTLELFRCTRDQIIGQAPYMLSPLLQPDGSKSRKKAMEKINAAASGIHQQFEWQHLGCDGNIFDAEISLHVIEVGQEKLLYGVIRDISKRKQAENELRIKSASLEELNTALKVLLRQREEDKKDLEDRVVSNVKRLVIPYIEKMKKNHLDLQQLSNLNILEANLNEIVSPFLHTVRQLNLTPRETQVASLVKDGKTTKEIAETIGVGISAVDSYRNSIREKLGLNNKKVNLQSYLQSLT
jgi:PAS domain S-box-containing protein